ncbi:MAG TPA: hypothetical protein VFQ91_20500 [Bryobacteraceae bacterium]|nr:hypothetical protein [Bryobacteraceae bacterium]
MTHVLTLDVLFLNKPGVLMRTIAIVSALGCNIASASVKPDPSRPGVTHMRLVTNAEKRLHRRIVEQMNSKPDVLLARDVTPC